LIRGIYEPKNKGIRAIVSLVTLARSVGVFGAVGRSGGGLAARLERLVLLVGAVAV